LQVRPEVVAALARFVDDEAPLARVERMAALARRNQAPTAPVDETLVPGNMRTGSKAELALGEARYRVARRSGAGRPQVPPAMQMLAMRAQGMTAAQTIVAGSAPVPERRGSAAVDLGSCGGCGGPLRVARLDLEARSVLLECMACGLRRFEEDAGDGTAPTVARLSEPGA
jgi:hypothetical protein